MRPVDKGSSPYKTIKKYQDALPYLEEKIGKYCSYCEMPIRHVPEVEHKVSKKHGGELTAWENLLLGCKYCNTRKKAETTTHNKEDYLWPDEKNTAIAYKYINGFPTVNEADLKELDPTGKSYEKAQNTYKLVGLGNEPDLEKGEKDKRLPERNASYYRALESLECWKHVKDAPDEFKKDMQKQIIMTAVSDGFFSVWMYVFIEEPQILSALIDNFPGTNKAFFEENGKVKKTLQGKM